MLPVLPALLSAGGVGGRRRPLGIVLGLSVTFTVTIVGLANVVDGVGLGSDPLRDVAIAVLLAFGLTLLVPGASARLEAPLSRLARFGPRTKGDGFLSGLLVGGALGFVYTPCASPILAAVISVSAASGRTVVIAVAYALGSAVILLALSLGGRRLFDRIRKAGRGPLLQRALGTVMILTAVAIVTNLDVSFDQFVAEKIPNVNLTASLECSKEVTGRLHEITGRKQRFKASNGASPCEGSSTKLHTAAKDASQATLLADAPSLPDLGMAPAFVGTEQWFNTPGDRPLTLAGLRGHVVLVDFWTYTCINCIRTLPYLESWYSLPTTATAWRSSASRRRSSSSSTSPPTWRARSSSSASTTRWCRTTTWTRGRCHMNEYWPADYLIDAHGQVCATRPSARAATTRPKRRSARCSPKPGYQVGAKSHPTDVVKPSEVATPETYTGTNRAEGWINGPKAGLHDYGPPKTGELPLNDFEFSGTWNIGAQPAEAVSQAGIDMEFKAKRVYLVLSSQDERPLTVRVLLDGRPISAADSGADVHDGVVTVRRQRLYSLVSLPGDQQHRLSLRFANGVTAWDFTFG